MKKFLRFIGVLFMGITAAVTLIGGVGTTCVALNPTAYDSMKAIASYQWLYILYVLIGVALGIPDASKWLKRHLVDPVPLLKKKELL